MLKILIVLLAVGFTNSAAYASLGNPDAQQGGTFVYNLDAEPTTLNPLTSTDLYSRNVQAFIVEGLLERNVDDYGWEPRLAEKWDISKDGKIFTFTLREGLTFHDGKPVTTEDVKFSFDAIFDDKLPTAHLRPYYENIEKAEIVDPRVIKFYAKTLYFQNFDVVAELTVLPKHIYNDPSNKKLNKEMYGTGPYKIASYDKGTKLTLEKNQAWWGTKAGLKVDKGRFNFAKLVFKFVKEENVQIEMLKKGELDYLEMRSETFMKKTEGPEWGTKVQKVKAENIAPKSYGFVGFNMRRPVFTDKKVRVALTHLFNRQLIIDKFLYGMSMLATGPWYQQSEYASKKAKPIPFDPKKGLALLKEAGWDDTDKDGVLDKTIDGKKTDFKFTLMTANSDTMKYFTIFKEDAKKVGVDIEIKLLEWNTFIKLVDERSFDAIAMGWSAVVNPDPKQIWHSSSDTASGSNFVGYRNPEVDKLIDEARAAMDKKKRIPLLQKVYEKIADDAPYIFLFNPKFIFYGNTAKMQKPKDTLNYAVGTEYWWTPVK
ncbi:MAG: peptide-binding protein [Bdellovibrionia bacterium]